jgi:hypothetical protein
VMFSRPLLNFLTGRFSPPVPPSPLG